MLAVRSILAAVSVLTLAGAAVAQVATGPAPNACPTGDCIKHSIQTQVSCTEESHAPAGTQIGWQAGLSTNADQKILGESVEKLELGNRALQVLESLGVSRIGDLAQYSDLDLFKSYGSGQSVVQELSTALGAFGISLPKPEIK